MLGRIAPDVGGAVRELHPEFRSCGTDPHEDVEQLSHDGAGPKFMRGDAMKFYEIRWIAFMRRVVEFFAPDREAHRVMW